MRKEDLATYGGHLRPVCATYGPQVSEEKQNIESFQELLEEGHLRGTTYSPQVPTTARRWPSNWPPTSVFLFCSGMVSQDFLVFYKYPFDLFQLVYALLILTNIYLILRSDFNLGISLFLILVDYSIEDFGFCSLIFVILFECFQS